MIPLLVFVLLLSFSLPQSEASVGICWKTPEKNQLPATEVVALLEKHNITRIRLYEPNQEILTALKGKDIEVWLGVPNSDLIPLATIPTIADLWLKANVTAYIPSVKIKYLIIGNEVCPNNDNNGISFFLMSALQNFQAALSKQPVLKDIKITSSFDISILHNPNRDLPFNMSFVSESLIFLDPILKFISGNGAPFMVNIYPYYAHVLNPSKVGLDYALFKASDGNLFEAMVGAMYLALEKAGYTKLEVAVAETGWPSAGGLATSVENQRTYITNVLEYVKKGCSKKPSKPIETCLFSMFDDEDVKGVPEIERHFGLFNPNKELKFVLPEAFN